MTQASHVGGKARQQIRRMEKALLRKTAEEAAADAAKPKALSVLESDRWPKGTTTGAKIKIFNVVLHLGLTKMAYNLKILYVCRDQ